MIAQIDLSTPMSLYDIPMGGVLILSLPRKVEGEYLIEARVITPEGDREIPVSSIADGARAYLAQPMGPGTLLGDIPYYPMIWGEDALEGIAILIDYYSEHEPLRGVVPVLAQPKEVVVKDTTTRVFPEFCDILWYAKGKDNRERAVIHALRRYQDADGTMHATRIKWHAIPEGDLVYVCTAYQEYGDTAFSLTGRTFMPVRWTAENRDVIYHDVVARTPLKEGFTLADVKAGYGPWHQDWIPARRSARLAKTFFWIGMIGLPMMLLPLPGWGSGLGLLWMVPWLVVAALLALVSSPDPEVRRHGVDTTVVTVNRAVFISQAIIMAINPEKRDLKNAGWLGFVGWAAHESKKTQGRHQAICRDRMR